MKNYKIKKNKVTSMLFKNSQLLSQNSFASEKELQSFFETNLKTILNLTFVDTEFIAGQYRLDTLAFDDETKSFRIIEYKNSSNNSLVDQGFAYLKLMLERKADFVLQYNNKLHQNITVNDVNWGQSRIIFVSPSFTPYQLDATNFNNAFDLIKVTRYEGDIIDIDFIKKTSSTKISLAFMNAEDNKVMREIETYDRSYHLDNITEKAKELYEELEKRILELGDIDVEIKKVYIAFKGKANIADVEFTRTKDEIRVNINMKKGRLSDPLGITKDMSNTSHWGNGDYRVTIENFTDIDNAMPLIRQSFEVNKK